MLMDANKTIEKYCGNIGDRLRVCRSRSIAIALKDRLCSRLRIQCVSDIVNNVLREHVDKIIDDMFDENVKKQSIGDRE